MTTYAIPTIFMTYWNARIGLVLTNNSDLFNQEGGQQRQIMEIVKKRKVCDISLSLSRCLLMTTRTSAFGFRYVDYIDHLLRLLDALPNFYAVPNVRP